MHFCLPVILQFPCKVYVKSGFTPSMSEPSWRYWSKQTCTIYFIAPNHRLHSELLCFIQLHLAPIQSRVQILYGSLRSGRSNPPNHPYNYAIIELNDNVVPENRSAHSASAEHNNFIVFSVYKISSRVRLTPPCLLVNLTT